jgi:predicted dehydrogenase
MLAPFSNLWCAHPLRAAAAHRAARRLIESGRIGAVSALALRWPRALHLDAANAGFAADYAAFDLLLWAASLPPRSARSVVPHAARVALDENGGASSLWIRFAHGFEGRALSATALFSAADEWNASWPRLEISGTQGRSIVCEAGRRVTLLEPREAAHTLEVPGIAPHLSHSNTLGIAEDLKAWLSHVARGDVRASGEEDTLEATGHGFAGAAATLRLLATAREALHEGAMIEVNLRRHDTLQTLPTRVAANDSPPPGAAFQPTLSLPLEERW